MEMSADAAHRALKERDVSVAIQAMRKGGVEEPVVLLRALGWKG